MFCHGMSRLEPLRVLSRAEIDALEQLRRQNDLRALLGGFANEGFRLGDVGLQVVAVRRLDSCDRDRALRH